jgi:hypothetical protein
LNQGFSRIVIAIDELNKYSESTDLITNFARTILRYTEDAIFLFVAQPEFERQYRWTNESLREFIVHVQEIKPFSKDDMTELVCRRLSSASVGEVRRNIFTKEAMSIIFEVSRGNPREALSLCGNALIYFAVKGKSGIDAHDLSGFLYETQAKFLLEHLDLVDRTLVQVFARVGENTNHLDPRVQRIMSSKGLHLKSDSIYRRLRNLAKEGLLVEKETGKGKPNLYSIRSDLSRILRSTPYK